MPLTNGSTPLPAALGAFARQAISELAPEGFRFVALRAGVVVLEHPDFGQLEMTNDSYTSMAVGPRPGLYADAVFSRATQIDDGEFELTLSGTDEPADVLSLSLPKVAAIFEGTDAAEADDTDDAPETAEAADAETDDAEAAEKADESETDEE